jgi:hypothetical protein
MSGVTGADRLLRDAKVLREITKQLTKELKGAADRPLGNFRRAVDARIQADFPKRYAGVFGGSWKIKATTSSGASLLRVKLVGTAQGRASIRDSAALNKGLLRHKTFGHLPWSSQGVTPGFWDEPAKELSAGMHDAAEVAAEKAAKAIEAQL